MIPRKIFANGQIVAIFPGRDVDSTGGERKVRKPSSTRVNDSPKAKFHLWANPKEYSLQRIVRKTSR
jgi:hypothetical protein